MPWLLAACAPIACTLPACSSESSSSSSSTDDGGGVDLGEPPFIDAGGPDGDKGPVDGGYVTPDGGFIRADRFITKVEALNPGDCSGFGASQMPDIVMGPPVGGGALSGGFDVLTLGIGGEIVVSFGANAIVDGDGPDFIVFENALYAGGDPNQPGADLGEVSVSEDGTTWTAFECVQGDKPPFGGCAGWHAVFSAPGNGISPLDPEHAGGEAYDLAMVGLAKARFVRIRDKSTKICEGKPKPTNLGFDLDAISILHAVDP